MHSLFSVSAYALYVYQAAWDLKGGFGAVGDPWCWDRRGKRQIFFFFLHVVLSLSLFFSEQKIQRQHTGENRRLFAASSLVAK